MSFRRLAARRSQDSSAIASRLSFRRGSARVSEPQQLSEFGLVEADHHMAIARIGFHDRSRRAPRAQLDQLVHVFAMLHDVPVFEGHAVLREPRPLLFTGASAGLVIDDDVHEMPPYRVGVADAA